MYTTIYCEFTGLRRQAGGQITGMLSSKRRRKREEEEEKEEGKEEEEEEEEVKDKLNEIFVLSSDALNLDHHHHHSIPSSIHHTLDE